MRTTLKRGIGRIGVVNGDGQAVLPPGVLSPVSYRQPERQRRALRTVGRVLFFVLAASCVAVVLGPWAALPVGAREPGQDDACRPFQAAADRLNVPKLDKPTVALVIGYDHRPEDGTRRPARTHSCSCEPSRTRTRSRCSFPRDLVVQIKCPDGRTAVDRINAAYSYCGPEVARDGPFDNRAPIHYLIGVNFDGFRQSVDCLGGIWLDIDRRYLNPKVAITRRSTSGPATSA